MKFIDNIEPIKVFVRNSWLTQNKKQKGFEEAYLIAVKSRPLRHLEFSVHLKSGALFSGIPITEIYSDRFNKIKYIDYSLDMLQPYSCLPGSIQVFKFNHFKDYKVNVKFLGPARYLFTIDYLGEGLSEDPEQIKAHNVLVLENGALCAMPNNFIFFPDKYFTEKSEKSLNYKRNSKYITGPA